MEQQLCKEYFLRSFWDSSWEIVDPNRIAEYIDIFDMGEDNLIATLRQYGVQSVCDADCGCGRVPADHQVNARPIEFKFVGDNMNAIGNRIKYMPATNDPLSADVYWIDGDEYCYFYDVGNNDRSLQYINQISKEKIVILSHHHTDHTGNIAGLHYRDLYVGQKTYEAIGKGIIIEDKFTINDGVKIDVIHCTSPHTDGSLIITVDNEYTLIADLYFTRPPFNKEKAMKMISTLRNIDTKYFVISHQEVEKVIPKERLIVELTDYFNQ